MARTRKVYSKEFKQKAVELSNVRGNVQEIARELGLNAEFITAGEKSSRITFFGFGGNGKSN